MCMGFLPPRCKPLASFLLRLQISEGLFKSLQGKEPVLVLSSNLSQRLPAKNSACEFELRIRANTVKKATFHQMLLNHPQRFSPSSHERLPHYRRRYLKAGGTGQRRVAGIVPLSVQRCLPIVAYLPSSV